MEKRMRSLLLITILFVAINSHFIQPRDDFSNAPNSDLTTMPNGGSPRISNPDPNQKNPFPQVPASGYPQFSGSNPNSIQ